MAGIHASQAGSGNGFVFNDIINTNRPQYNLRSAAEAAGWNGLSPLLATVTVNSGVKVSATSTGVWAFDTGSGFPSGSKLELLNYGEITGLGGAGGGGRGYNTSGALIQGYNGSGGGPGLLANWAITISNYGFIAGGGGGGGGGGGSFHTFNVKDGQYAHFGGGGGGGGRTNAYNVGGGPAGTTSVSPGTANQGGSGGTATASGPGGGGGGGSSAAWPGFLGGSGGAGGAFGQAGASGGAASFSNPGGTHSPTAGAGGGAAVGGNGNITWAPFGAVYGAVT